MGTVEATLRVMNPLPVFFFCTLLFVVIQGRVFADEFPNFQHHVLLDARMAVTDNAVSWLDAGLGKTRFGGDDNGERLSTRTHT